MKPSDHGLVHRAHIAVTMLLLVVGCALGTYDVWMTAQLMRIASGE